MLHSGSEADILKIGLRCRKLKLPVCTDVENCGSWDWDQCPVGAQEILTGKEERKCCSMEATGDENLSIWPVNFGILRSTFDMIVMQNSCIFKKIRSKDWSCLLPRFEVQGFGIKTKYWLSRVIYPRILLFSLPHLDPRTKKMKPFRAHHLSSRNAVESVL